jgi:hypothetical protein
MAQICSKSPVETDYLIRDFGMLFGIEVLADGDHSMKLKLNVAGTERPHASNLGGALRLGTFPVASLVPPRKFA